MTLGFMQKWENGEPTYFIEKIWNSFVISSTPSTIDNTAVQHFYYDQLQRNQFGEGQDLSAEHTPKLHTIRFLNKRQAAIWSKKGRMIDFVINNQTPNRFQFAPRVAVQSVQRISILKRVLTGISAYRPESNTMQYLSSETIETLAINDGFDSLEQFWEYFNEKTIEAYAKKGKYPHLIHWTKLKY